MQDQDLVNTLRIAAPCPMSWDSMVGDNRVRFCDKCQLNVYNTSLMSATETVQLIKEKEGRVCIQLYRRSDGTVITDNCPVGLRAVRNAAKAVLQVICAAIGLMLSLPAGAQLKCKSLVSTEQASSPITVYPDPVPLRKDIPIFVTGGGPRLAPWMNPDVKLKTPALPATQLEWGTFDLQLTESRSLADIQRRHRQKLIEILKDHPEFKREPTAPQLRQ
jgi:hypothetical protein